MMKQTLLVCTFIAIAATASSADEVLGGIEGLACQAKPCLSTGSPPSECGPALDYYYSLKGKTSSRTAALRKAFLARCPMVSQAPADDATATENYYVADRADVMASPAFAAGQGLYIQDANGIFTKAFIDQNGVVFLNGKQYHIQDGQYVPHA